MATLLIILLLGWLMDHNVLAMPGQSRERVSPEGDEYQEMTTMKLMATALTIAVVTGLAATGALADGGPTGIWRINSGKVTVKIEECGNALCGTIVDLAKPLDKNGAPKVDRENPDPALRRRPLIGITVLDHMRPNGDNKWSGTIYNADDGYTYSSKMSLNGDIMKVKGCVLFICKAMKFTRVN